MNNKSKINAPISFWTGLILFFPAIWFIATSFSVIRSLWFSDGLGGLALIYVIPLVICVASIAAMMLIGLYRKNRVALIMYMLYIPFGLSAVISFIVGGNELPSPGYGAVSSMVLTAYSALGMVLFTALEYFAWKDLKSLTVKSEQALVGGENLK